MRKKMEKNRKWMDYLGQIIKRFAQDLLGILLTTFAVISFLGLIGLTGGALTEIWVKWILSGFGWGGFTLVGFLGYVGLLILLRHFQRFPKFNLNKIINLEIFFFSSLALFSLIGGMSIERANIGLDGGRIGWGLAYSSSRLVGKPLSFGLFTFLTLFGLAESIGINQCVWDRLDQNFEKVLSTSLPIQKESSSETSKRYTVSNSAVYQKKDNFKDSVLTKEAAQNSDLPSLELLLEPQKLIADESYIHSKAIQIEKTLNEFGVPVRVAGYRIGPTVLQYAVEPGFLEKVNDEGDIVKRKVKVSQISALKRDLSLALSVDRLRIEAPIPGTSFVGIEIPNISSSVVRLKSVMKTDEFIQMPSRLKLALGLDVSGNPILADLSRMPHLLIAGTTGAGKSVCITALITCLIMNNPPEELKLAILDPKMVELVRFNGLPHLLGKVETEISRMLGILAWAVQEMESRYRLLESIHARDIDSYNIKARRRGRDFLPKIVIVIDELADLMMSAPEQTEGYLVRLAQMARATGIHLIVATQRPSTDIITGLIKANFPARISFMMATSIDSRVVLDKNGAETLMGRGDMLILNPDETGLLRAQCVMVDDREIEGIISYWQSKDSPLESEVKESPWEDLVPLIGEDKDELIQKAAELIRKEGRASTSWLQRKLHIGFPRAARLMDELEELGVVGPMDSGERDREILIDDKTSEDIEE